MRINFKKLLREDVRGANTVVANFQTEKANDVEVFIREFLQNVLDNRIRSNGGHDEATVKINFVEINDDSKKDYIKNIFDPALPYIRAADPYNGLKNTDVTSALILEEYNTQGITGVKNNSNDAGKWAKFWHHQDDGNKVGSKNGRAGQGKITYFMMSNVWSVFGLTNPIDDLDKVFLMGKCVLPRSILYNGEAYKYNAFISDYEKFDDGDNQPTPYVDDKIIESFCNVFSISRKPGDPGTSWVIPFPNHNPKEEELVVAVIKFYFYSILRERLTVYVGDTEINKETISQLAKKFLPAADADFYDFINEAVDISTEYRRVTVRNDVWAKPNQTTFPTDLISNDDIEKLRNDLNKGEIVYVRLHINIKPKVGKKIDSYFDVYLKSDKSIKKTREAFIRSDLFIASEIKFANIPSKVFSLVVAEDEGVASFLADAEEPNHLLFNAAKQLVNENYKDVQNTLRAIRNGAIRTYNHLTQSESETIDDLFLGLISFPSSGTKKKKKKNRGVVAPPPPPPTPPPPARAPWFRIKEGIGAEIRPGERRFKPEHLPVRIIIQAGYQSAGSNPFNDHHPFDFNFMDEDSVSIELKNMKRIDGKVSPNVIEFDIESADFYAKFSGFDSNRRLKVKGKLDDTNLPDDEELLDDAEL